MNNENGSSSNGSNAADNERIRDQNVMNNRRTPKTTKLGMEIESDDDEEDEVDGNQKEESRIFKNGSFTSNFLRNRNLFNLRLTTTDSTSPPRLSIDGIASNALSLLPKKSPVTPYSRQTSSSDSQKSANSLQPQIFATEWENAGSPSQRRTNSISSCYSITESIANENGSMTQSKKIH